MGVLRKGSMVAAGSSKPKKERLLHCQLWLSASQSCVTKSLVGFLEALQEEMDKGRVPGLLHETVDAEGMTDGSPGTELDFVAWQKEERMQSGSVGLPLTFPVWLTLSYFGLTDMCAARTRFGPGRDTIRSAFVLTAKRNGAELSAWLPFLEGDALSMANEALAVAMEERLGDGLLPAGAKTARARHRAV